MCLDVLIFDLIPVEGNDTFQSEIEAHQGPRSASIRLDPPRVDFHWASSFKLIRAGPERHYELNDPGRSRARVSENTVADGESIRSNYTMSVI